MDIYYNSFRRYYMAVSKKILSLLTLTIFSFSLIACQQLDAAKDGVNNDEVGEKVVIKMDPMSESEYEVAVNSKATDFYTALTEMLQYLSEKQTVDQQDVERFYKDYENLQNIANEIIAFVPPASYEKADEAYKKSMDEFQLFLDGFKRILDEKDFSTFSLIHEHAALGEKWLNRASALLAITYDRPVGNDGTITTADLKSLDQHEGIDRDSVLLNVSEDGNELIGKWGYYNEDGSFNISVVLEADGRYAGYGKDEYPETDMTGTWKYEFLDSILIFEHDNSDFRTVTMELLSFKDGTFKLRDVDTWNSYHYVKEGTPNSEEDN